MNYKLSVLCARFLFCGQFPIVKYVFCFCSIIISVWCCVCSFKMACIKIEGDRLIVWLVHSIVDRLNVLKCKSVCACERERVSFFRKMVQ